MVNKRSAIAAAAFLASLTGIAARPSVHQQLNQDIVDHRMEALLQLERGVAPLLVLGDVNEDGKVDAADAALIERLAAGELPAEATCPAAADFNMDGKVDAYDVQIARQMLAEGQVRIPPLRFPFKLDCSFQRLAVAARPAAAADGTNKIYFLDSSFNTHNSKVEVAKGDASVTALPGGNGFLVISAVGSAPRVITVMITLGENGSGGRYYYSFSVGSELQDEG